VRRQDMESSAAGAGQGDLPPAPIGGVHAALDEAKAHELVED